MSDTAKISLRVAWVAWRPKDRVERIIVGSVCQLESVTMDRADWTGNRHWLWWYWETDRQRRRRWGCREPAGTRLRAWLGSRSIKRSPSRYAEHTLVCAPKRCGGMRVIYGGLVAGILAADIAIGGGGIFTLGRIRSSLVMPFSIFVMPIMGASPFRTNS